MKIFTRAMRKTDIVVSNVKNTMKPLLKWVGGKTQILSSVLAEFPLTMESYHEPFLGGGSVLLGVLTSNIEIHKTIYASDINPHLINFYMTVRDSPEELIVQSHQLETTDSPEDFYYTVRSTFNGLESKTGPRAAAMFLYLNKMGFRGVYREGPNGFNVPYGHYTSPYTTPDTEIRSISRVLQPVVFRCQEFEKSLAFAKEGDFVYLDPPYVPVNTTSFVGYVAGGFHRHAELFHSTKALPCRFLMSNADVPIVRDAFPGYSVKSITCRRAIHSKDPSSTVQEVFITRSV